MLKSHPKSLPPVRPPSWAHRLTNGQICRQPAPRPLGPPPLVPSPGLPNWRLQCRVGRKYLSVQAYLPNGTLMLRARLPLLAAEPMALHWLLDALGRYSGHRLCAVVAASASCEAAFCSAFIDREPQLASSYWVDLRFDLPAWGLRASTPVPNVQPELSFDDMEF